MQDQATEAYRVRIQRSVLAATVALLLTNAWQADAAPKSEQSASLDALHASDPKLLEGVWLPEMRAPGGPPGGKPPAGAAQVPGGGPPPEVGGLGSNEAFAGGPPGGPPGGGPPGAGPGGPGGGPPGGGFPPGDNGEVKDGGAGTMLSCAPLNRSRGAGGGLANLWIQSKTEIVWISEEDHDIARTIYLDAKHPANPKPQPNGHSIGHWDGNTLVVDTIAFADSKGVDTGQHVVERFRKDGDTLHDEMTTTDKSGASRKMTWTMEWRPDLHVYENICEEGFDRYIIVDGKLDNPNVPANRKKK